MAGLLVFPHAEVMLKDLAPELSTASLQPCAIGADSHSVYVALPTPQGRWVVATFDLALLLTAAEAFTHVHGDPRQCQTSRKTDSRKAE